MCKDEIKFIFIADFLQMTHQSKSASIVHRTVSIWSKNENLFIWIKQLRFGAKRRERLIQNLIKDW